MSGVELWVGSLAVRCACVRELADLALDTFDVWMDGHAWLPNVFGQTASPEQFRAGVFDTEVAELDALASKYLPDVEAAAAGQAVVD